MRKLLDEFREFAVRGNVVDMATGIILGGAFGTIVSSLVSDVVMPPIGLLIADVNFNNLFLVLRDGAVAAGPYATLADARAAGAVTLNYGEFANSVITFLIVAWCVFLLVRAINRVRRYRETPPAPNVKNCPFCLSMIQQAATRCPQCTSQLDAHAAS